MCSASIFRYLPAHYRQIAVPRKPLYGGSTSTARILRDFGTHYRARRFSVYPAQLEEHPLIHSQSILIGVIRNSAEEAGGGTALSFAVFGRDTPPLSKSRRAIHQAQLILRVLWREYRISGTLSDDFPMVFEWQYR
jgi:hypothetical protein